MEKYLPFFLKYPAGKCEEQQTKMFQKFRLQQRANSSRFSRAIFPSSSEQPSRKRSKYPPLSQEYRVNFFYSREYLKLFIDLFDKQRGESCRVVLEQTPTLVGHRQPFPESVVLNIWSSVRWCKST